MREEKPIHVWVVLGMDERTELPATIRVAASRRVCPQAGKATGAEEALERAGLWHEEGDWRLLQQLRDDPVGDLGELAASVDWPQGEGLASLRWTLRERWPEYEEALERAWGEYRKVLHVDPASS
ncbi:hypothetical protein [Allomeiothermus silvanus]|nr:hypothetical protein [Allomeiothermus silvanus]